MYDSTYKSESDDNNIAALPSGRAHKQEPLNAKVQFDEIFSSSMVNSVSACSIIKVPQTKYSKTLPKIYEPTLQIRGLKTFFKEP